MYKSRNYDKKKLIWLNNFDTNNNNNFVDFIFDMKISVPKQSIDTTTNKIK